jgi:hypothetical protein
MDGAAEDGVEAVLESCWRTCSGMMAILKVIPDFVKSVIG